MTFNQFRSFYEAINSNQFETLKLKNISASGFCISRVMSDKQGGKLIFYCMSKNKLPVTSSQFLIKFGKRFIQQQDFRLGEQSAYQCNSCPLAFLRMSSHGLAQAVELLSNKIIIVKMKKLSDFDTVPDSLVELKLKILFIVI